MNCLPIHIVILQNTLNYNIEYHVVMKIKLRLLVLLNVFSLCVSAVPWDGISKTAWNNVSGVNDGTSADKPFLIETPKQLAKLAELVNAGNNYSGVFFKLTADIDLGNKNWTCIGDVNAFSGNFNGNWHTISNLSITKWTNNIGLFGLINSATIKNLGVESGTITCGGNNAGALVGQATGTVLNLSVISNCYNRATVVKGASDQRLYIGGIAGLLQSYTTIDHCYNMGNVTNDGHANSSQTGGIAGAVATGSTIFSCYSTGIVIGNNIKGGVVGSNWSATTYAYYDADVCIGTNAATQAMGNTANTANVTGLTTVNMKAASFVTTLNVTGNSWIASMGKYPVIISNRGGNANTQIPEARVKMENGYPQLFVNGKHIPPVMTFVNTGIAASYDVSQHQIYLASKYADVHLHQVNTGLPAKKANGEYDFNNIQKALQVVHSADPTGFVILRVLINQNYSPNGIYSLQERVFNADSTYSNTISIASDKWLSDTKERLDAIVKYIKNNPTYGPMVIGYLPETGEWFQHKFRESGVDASEVNTIKFRHWLKEKYGKNVSRLQTSWNNKSVTFQNALIPADKLKKNWGQKYSQKLYDGPSEQRILDYLDYYNNLTVDRICDIAKTVKKASDGKSIFGTFYGYTLELADSKSGHYALNKMLECRDLDYLAAPLSYFKRLEGEVGASMSLVESIQSHGKLWFDEVDHQTCFRTAEGASFADWTPKVKNKEFLTEVLRRQFGFQMIQGKGSWIMDLEGRGWYDDADFWKEIGALKCPLGRYENIRPTFNPEVALVVDEEGMAVGADWENNSKMLHILRNELYKAGVNFGSYLRNDLENGLVPNAKLYIMVGAFRLKPSTVDKLATELKKQGKTVVWIYGLGKTKEEYVKKLPGNKIAESTLKASQIRDLAQKAGAHIFLTGGFDATMANSNLLVFHTSGKGQRTVHFPAKVDAYEQFTNTWYSNVDSIQLDVPFGKTYFFFYGKKADLMNAKIGI